MAKSMKVGSKPFTTSSTKEVTHVSGRAFYEIHPKVAVPLIAALVYSMLAPLAAKVGIDLTGMEANVQALVMFIAGYLTPSN